MGFLEAVDVYFRGERYTGLALVPLGLVLAAAGAYLFYWYAGSLGKSMGIPLLVVGLAGGIGGGILVKTVNDRQARLAKAFEADQEAPRAAERERIDKVNANWPVLKATWAGLTVLALGLLVFVGRDWVKGLALALVCLCAIALVIDTFAENRARVYAERIGASSGAQ